ncbi:MAG: isoaspartyl peptidase/L-asparaginase [Longimicrobiales bacterium]
MPTRRQFLKTSAAAAAITPLGLAGVAAPGALGAPPFVRRSAPRPVAIASANGLAAVTRAVEGLLTGEDTIDAVVAGVNIVELDPADASVGYGGLPNEEGVVQLDASVMHGPTRGAGAVAALEGVKTPSRVALAVMRYTDHVLLVGEGARRFARAMGFDTAQELLTDASRLRWLRWRAGLSPADDWLAPAESAEGVSEFPRADTVGLRAPVFPSDGPDAELAALDSHDGVRPMGTINCNAVDPNGAISGVTTTSGLFGKLPGRVGDSPLIGAGLYVDNDVGACGSTGRGEAVIKTCGSHTVVEAMRRGASPTDACLEALRRIVTFTVEPRLLREDGSPNFNVNFYAVNKDGDVGAAAIYAGSRFAVNVEGNGEIRDSAYLLERG